MRSIIATITAAVCVSLAGAAYAHMCCGSQHHAVCKTGGGQAQDKEKITRQAFCPVKSIDENLYADHDGKRVYVCRRGCLDVVKENPARYIKKLEDAGVTPARVQTTCPVMGGDVNKDQYADHAGKRIYVCCPGCIPTIKANPEKYINKLEAEGVALDRVAAKQGANPDKQPATTTACH